MPLQLTNDIGDEYWFHNSGGEHTGKHALDPQEVLALARSAQTSLALSHDELWKLMYNDGLFVAMTYRDDEGVGAVAGRPRQNHVAGFAAFFQQFWVN